MIIVDRKGWEICEQLLCVLVVVIFIRMYGRLLPLNYYSKPNAQLMPCTKTRTTGCQQTNQRSQSNS